MQQSDLFAEHEPIAAYVARRTGCNMKFNANQATLAAWVARVGEDQIRERLKLSAYPYPQGTRHGDPRFLNTNWTWVVTAPAEQVFAFAF